MANEESADARMVAAAVAVAEIEGEQIATAVAERERQGLQEELKAADGGIGTFGGAHCGATKRCNGWVKYQIGCFWADSDGPTGGFGGTPCAARNAILRGEWWWWWWW
eukprot:7130090-Pyramimonas_sp.AAC.1